MQPSNNRRSNPASKLTPEDVVGIRDALGLDVEQFAKAMGVTKQAVLYWEAGLRVIPKGPAILMQAYEEYPSLIGRYEV